MERPEVRRAAIRPAPRVVPNDSTRQAMLRGLITPARLVMAVFFMEGAILANWLARIPDLQTRLDVGPGDLSLALLGMPIALVVALPVIGSLVERLTPRRAILFAFCFLAVIVALPGWTSDVPGLFAVLFLFGLAYPVVDVAMNVEANRIERASGRRIMSTCHGFWSIGAATGAFVGAGFAQAGLDMRWHLLLVGILTLAFALVVPPALPALSEEQAGDGLPRRVLTMPTIGMLGVCTYAFGMVLIEMGTRNWSAVFLRDSLSGAPAAAGAGYGAFAAAMAIGRLAGDRLTDLWGPVVLSRICGVIAVAGIVAVVTAVNLPIALAGFTLAGLGASVAYPLAVTAVASRGDRPAPVNVAAFSLVTSVSSLVAPPLIGFVAQAGGLRLGLAMLLPPLILSTLLAGEVGRPAGAANSAGAGAKP